MSRTKSMKNKLTRKKLDWKLTRIAQKYRPNVSTDNNVITHVTGPPSTHSPQQSAFRETAQQKPRAPHTMDAGELGDDVRPAIRQHSQTGRRQSTQPPAIKLPESFQPAPYQPSPFQSGPFQPVPYPGLPFQTNDAFAPVTMARQQPPPAVITAGPTTATSRQTFLLRRGPSRTTPLHLSSTTVRSQPQPQYLNDNVQEQYADYSEPEQASDSGEQQVALKGKVRIHGDGFIECLDMGSFPHPFSCRKFISCAKTEYGSLLGWEYTCPKGLSFDPVGGICNWSSGPVCNNWSRANKRKTQNIILINIK